MIGRNIYGNHI